MPPRAAESLRLRPACGTFAFQSGVHYQPGTIDPLDGSFIVPIEEHTGIEGQAPTADAPGQVVSEFFKSLDSRLELGPPRLRQASPVLFGWRP